MNKKQAVLVDVFKECLKTNNFIFHNDLIKEYCLKHDFKNPFDVTHIEASKLLPEFLKEKDYFVLHIGKGKHKFIKGISKGYHCFEDVTDVRDWSYKKSILNEFDTSESNILSVVANQGIVNDFMSLDRSICPKKYNPRRTNVSGEFYVGNQLIALDNQQIEIDQTIEHDGNVTVFEAKNKLHDDFSIYQIYYPFLYYTKIKEDRKLPIKQITCCYLLRKQTKGRSMIKLYLYTFSKPYDFTSIQLIKNKQYNLIGK